MPFDNDRRWILTDAAYIDYLERVVLAATQKYNTFDCLNYEAEQFCIYNIREAIDRQRNYRKKSDE